MVALFERLGGTLRLNDKVSCIHTVGNRASEVETASGWRERFDAVASNADLMHTYRDLLSRRRAATNMPRSWPRSAGRPAFRGAFRHGGQMARHPASLDPLRAALQGPAGGYLRPWRAAARLLDLSPPPHDQRSLAGAEGHSSFYALVPVAHLGKLPIDWDTIGPVLEKRILDEIGLRFIPDIHDRITTKFHYAHPISKATCPPIWAAPSALSRC
jgi:phytoene desaturase